MFKERMLLKCRHVKFKVTMTKCSVMYRWLRALVMFDVTCFPAFVGASDVISSVLSIRKWRTSTTSNLSSQSSYTPVCVEVSNFISVVSLYDLQVPNQNFKCQNKPFKKIPRFRGPWPLWYANKSWTLNLV